MPTPKSFATGTPQAACTVCGIPPDSEYFDESGDAEPPSPGKAVVLARFELPPQHCGVLEYFSQFTDLHAQNASQIRTPGLEWRILSNNRPLYPYIRLNRIVNPWGYGSFPIALRLDENSVIEFVVRGVSSEDSGSGDVITTVAGRIVGRYWYNTAYEDAQRRRF
jgi:hypothetical protein